MSPSRPQDTSHAGLWGEVCGRRSWKLFSDHNSLKICISLPPIIFEATPLQPADALLTFGVIPARGEYGSLMSSAILTLTGSVAKDAAVSWVDTVQAPQSPPTLPNHLHLELPSGRPLRRAPPSAGSLLPLWPPVFPLQMFTVRSRVFLRFMLLELLESCLQSSGSLRDPWRVWFGAQARALPCTGNVSWADPKGGDSWWSRAWRQRGGMLSRPGSEPDGAQ